jgi:hypothetical protein
MIFGDQIGVCKGKAMGDDSEILHEVFNKEVVVLSYNKTTWEETHRLAATGMRKPR